MSEALEVIDKAAALDAATTAALAAAQQQAGESGDGIELRCVWMHRSRQGIRRC